MTQSPSDIDNQLALFESIIQFSDDAIITKTLDGIVTSWNKAAELIFGYTAFEAIGASITAIIPETLLDEEKSILLKIKNGGYVRHYETVRLHKKGHQIHISLTVSPLKDKSGIITGVSKIARDLTEKRKKEDELRLIESVIANTADGVIVTDTSLLEHEGSGITFVNETFTRMTGYTLAEVKGKTPRILHGRKTDRSELDRLKASLGRKEPCEITVANYKKNGELFWNNMSVNPVFDRNGECTHFVAMLRDVTARKTEESRKLLLSDISFIFNENETLHASLHKTLGKLMDFGQLNIAEVWLLSPSNQKFELAAKLSTGKSSGSGTKNNLWTRPGNKEPKAREQGLKSSPGTTLADLNGATHAPVAEQTQSPDPIYVLQLTSMSQTIGVLVLAAGKDENLEQSFGYLYDELSKHLGQEIKRKQTEQELNQIFDAAPDIICMVGFDGFLKKINPTATQLLGFSAGELLAVPFYQFIHKDDLTANLSELRRLGTGKREELLELRVVTKAGKVRWLSLTAVSVPEDATVFCVARDITDKKELEGLYKKASTLALVGGFDMDLVNRVTSWTDTLLDIHELEPGSTPAFGAAADFIEEPYKTLGEAARDRTLAQGTPLDMEVVIKTAKGNRKWVRIICNAEFHDGKCVRILGSYQDIDARKKAELAEKKALEERNNILESIDDGFYAVDKNWVITYWNHRVERLLGKLKDEVLGENLWEQFPASVNSDSFKYYHFAIETQQPVRFTLYADQLQRWYEVSAYPSESGLSVYFKDITARKTAELQLTELNEHLLRQTHLLESSNTELERFAFIASHDLQEPLRMITSFITLLDQGYGHHFDAKGKKYIQFVNTGARQMRQIILDLLAFSRIGNTEIYYEQVDLNVVVGNVLQQLSETIEATNAKIHIQPLPALNTIASLVEQVFCNLVGNSLKYISEGTQPEIDVSFTDNGSHFTFFVKDNGIGIEEEYFDRIFVLFQRLHTSIAYSGTGMGLAATKKIIENMGGTIGLTSVVGQGSQFYFTLPKQEKK